MNDVYLAQIINAEPDTTYQKINQTIKKTVDHGVILEAKLEKENEDVRIYFLNSPKGRAAIKTIQEGKWNPKLDESYPLDTLEEPVNIFQIYESNIGALTPMIAEALREAEDTYPFHWIEDAIRIAVERNKRSWRYAEAILKRWQLEGRDVKKEKSNNQRDSEKNRRRYVEGEFSDFIEH
jgi:DNA replication protein